MVNFEIDPSSLSDVNRRNFLKSSVGLAAFPFFPETGMGNSALVQANHPQMAPEKSIIGQYGTWATSLTDDVPALSYRNTKWNNVDDWKKQAAAKALECIAAPPAIPTPDVKVERKFSYDGLDMEELSWQLPYGRATKAVLIKPKNVTKPLPGILALHDHAGMKYFGYRKIVKTGDDQHPLLMEHQQSDYGGKAWANEVAKRGYVVLVHDTFAFASRRVMYDDVTGLDNVPKSNVNPEESADIETYNRWSSDHEHVMSKSLFSAGTTWPGVFLNEDQVALDILSRRKEVDPSRLGCGGLSGGGLRTVYLAGMDPRVKCAVCVGFMTTWADLILHKSFTHTWMTYTPLLPRYMDFPEILGLRVPLPTMVLNNNQDELYTLEHMKKADRILQDVFRKANAADKYNCRYYDGPHKFDQDMQKDAFAWFDQWLA